MFEIVATYICICGRGVGVGLAVEHWCLHIHSVCSGRWTYIRGCEVVGFVTVIHTHDNVYYILCVVPVCSQESKQRCACEIISGIIRGSKHWTFDMVLTHHRCIHISSFFTASVFMLTTCVGAPFRFRNCVSSWCHC